MTKIIKKHYLNHCGLNVNTSGCLQQAECNTKRAEDVFTEIISEEVCVLFFSGYAEQRNAKKMLKTLIYPQINQLVEEHTNEVAEKIAEKLKSDFDIKGEVDYDHAPHAKLWTLFETLKEKIKKNNGEHITNGKKCWCNPKVIKVKGEQKSKKK